MYLLLDCDSRLFTGVLSTWSIELHVDDGIIVLITLSSCLHVISENSLLLSPFLLSVFSSHSCVLMLLVITSSFGSWVHSWCLFACVGEVLLLEAIGCALMKFAYDLHTDVLCVYNLQNSQWTFVLQYFLICPSSPHL